MDTPQFIYDQPWVEITTKCHVIYQHKYIAKKVLLIVPQ